MKHGAKLWVVAVACAAAGVAHAGMAKDRNGNVGFDTLAECQAAVGDRSVGFYQPFSSHQPKLLNGAVSVKQTTLREALQSPADVIGYCNKGLPRKQGRDGVSPPLQGKFIPLDPNMAVNAYSNRKGELLSVRMQKCDNWMDANFSSVSAKPVAQPVAPVPAPVVVAPTPVPAPAPVVVKPLPAPVAVVAPVAAAVAAPATSSWWWLAAPVVACAVLDCFDNDETTTTTTSPTTSN